MSEQEKGKPVIKPLFLIKPKTMSRRDISRAERLGGVCIVECDDTDAARFLSAPIDAELDVQAAAALKLFRVISGGGLGTGPWTRGDLTRFFVDQLLNAPPPKPVPSVRTK